MFFELPITRTPDNSNLFSISLEGSSYRESTVYSANTVTVALSQVHRAIHMTCCQDHSAIHRTLSKIHSAVILTPAWLFVQHNGTYYLIILECAVEILLCSAFILTKNQF